MARYLYSELATALQARQNCIGRRDISTPIVNPEWLEKWETYIDMLSQSLPSGSGIDTGTKIDLDRSHAERLVFDFSYHHMDEGGGYDGWTTHTATVTPSFSSSPNLRISGRNRNDIKDYLADTFMQALTTDVSLTWFQFHFGDKVPKITSRWIDGCTQEWSADLSTPDNPHVVSGSRSMVLESVVQWCEAKDWR